MKKKSKSIDIFSLSFLDVVSCGFGAIILLLVLSKVSEPLVVEKMSKDLSGQVQELEQQLHKIRGESQVMKRQLEAVRRHVIHEQEQLAGKQSEIARFQSKYEAGRTDLAVQERIEQQLRAARQSLTEEMRRLQAAKVPAAPDS
ncbi:MAG: hypothetical protein L3J49_12815, partial [Desulfobulbaceae bacterium]|nr:hypothetical protein [Desulfobulbaceae bacterium]